MSIHEIENPVRTARVAGLFYLLQIPLGVFGILYVPNALVVSGDMAATASNILAKEFIFRLSIMSALLCALVTIITALYLYQILKPVNKNYAALMVIFTMVSAPIAMLNELSHVAVLLMLKEPNYLTVISTSQIEVLLPFFFDLHKYGIQIVGIFFGLWLLPMGYLVYKSSYIPKIIGVFLMVTGFGYLTDFVAFFLLPHRGIEVSNYTFVGEVIMVLWLLIKGVRIGQWERMHIAPVAK